MTRFTMKSLNAELRAMQIEFVKGRGYFYLADLGDSLRCVSGPSTSIYVYAFSHLTESEWRERIASVLLSIGVNAQDVAEFADPSIAWRKYRAYLWDQFKTLPMSDLHGREMTMTEINRMDWIILQHDKARKGITQ